MPLGGKIMVDASDGELAGCRLCKIGRESLNVRIASNGRVVAQALSAVRIRLRFILVPYLLNQGVNANRPWVEGSPRISGAIVGHGSWVQVVNGPRRVVRQ